jgi:hypothetical protein
VALGVTRGIRGSGKRDCGSDGNRIRGDDGFAAFLRFMILKKLQVFLNIPNVFVSLIEKLPNDRKKARKKAEFQVCRSLRKIPQRSGPSF